jgi:hypothetical protein
MTAGVRGRTVQAALLGATVLALMNGPHTIGQVAAKVGVTSATDGDPLGKPPQEAERVLRIGVDVQANELVTTSANDRAHLVFLDGSSLTVGPNAQLVIDKFVFDPNTKTGELAISASKGVLRLVGGRISKTGPITITTPANTVGIRGGITILDVKANQTDAVFVFGKDLKVTAAGQTQIATRPGSQIVTNLGQPPGLPIMVPQGALAAQLSALEGRRGGQSSRSSSGGTGASGPDQVAQSSGMSGINSSQSVRVIAPGVPDNFGSGPGPRNRNASETIATALTNANQATQTTIAVQAQQQQQQQARTPPPVLDFNGFFTGALPPLSSFDIAKLNINPNSRLTTESELNSLNLQRATATYNGPVIAIINGARVDGTYQNAWNFGSRNGIATIRIDNSTYGGGSAPNTFLSGNGPIFTSNGSIPSTSGPTGRNAAVGGAFLSTPERAANQQVGGVILTGPNSYQGFGLFSGTR